MKNSQATRKFFLAGEFTTTHSQAHGFYPNRTCGHRHHTREAAEKCSSAHYPWIVYVSIDGRILNGSQEEWAASR